MNILYVDHYAGGPALGMEFRQLRLRRNPACPMCGEHRSITQLIDYEQFCGLRPDEQAAGISEIEPEELKSWAA